MVCDVVNKQQLSEDVKFGIEGFLIIIPRPRITTLRNQLSQPTPLPPAHAKAESTSHSTYLLPDPRSSSHLFLAHSHPRHWTTIPPPSPHCPEMPSTTMA